MNDVTPPTNDAAAGPRFPRWLVRTLLGALALLIVAYAAIFLYAKVLNDSPDELGRQDLDAALSVGGPTTDPVAVGPATWNITKASELGYRVDEVLFGVDTQAVGRTDQVTGTLVIDDTMVTDAAFVVDVASITSDQGRRDGQFRSRIMNTDEFPEATFTLSEPIDLGTASADGVAVDTSATGDLTLRGVTRAVTFDVSARQQAGRIGVLGTIPVVFADYGIENPSIGGITTDDHGALEFVLVFAPA